MDQNLLDTIIIAGDLAKLTPIQRTDYYQKVCQSLRLNPLTRPFEFQVFNGKMVLYARKDATDQLRKLNDVSVVEVTEDWTQEGILIVTTKVRDKEGRTDVAKGVVNIQGLKGDAKANSVMRAETKAKRRATLSICGLGMMDEEEAKDTPADLEGPPISLPPLVEEETPAALPPLAPHQIPLPVRSDGKRGWLTWGKELIERIKFSTTESERAAWVNCNGKLLEECAPIVPNIHRSILAAAEAQRAKLATLLAPEETGDVLKTENRS